MVMTRKREIRSTIAHDEKVRKFSKLLGFESVSEFYRFAVEHYLTAQERAASIEKKVAEIHKHLLTTDKPTQKPKRIKANHLTDCKFEPA